MSNSQGPTEIQDKIQIQQPAYVLDIIMVKGREILMKTKGGDSWKKEEKQAKT